MSSTYSAYIPEQRNLERRERNNAHISLVIGKMLPWVAYPLLLLGAVKGFNLSGFWLFTKITYPLAKWTYLNAPLLWETVPYPDLKTGLLQQNPAAFAISLVCWVSWFVGLVMLCNGLVKKSKGLYESSAERKRNIGIHEAVASAIQMQGNTVNVSGMDNSVNASNTINNYVQSPDKDWKVNAGLWLAITGAAGNLFAEFLTELFKKLFGG